jgi:hypothetical protein
VAWQREQLPVLFDVRQTCRLGNAEWQERGIDAMGSTHVRIHSLSEQEPGSGASEPSAG